MGIGALILRSPRLTMVIGVAGVLTGLALLLTFFVILPAPDATADNATLALIAAVAIVVGVFVFWVGYRKRAASLTGSR